jgi:plastocyanin
MYDFVHHSPPVQQPTIHILQINVAAGGFVFSPANITAANGTTVTFWFPK